MFTHERLIVYHHAAEFVALADAICDELPRGRSYLVDQLRRAAASIQLNIAEGAGEFSRQDKARFYRMALRSATECAALLDICARQSLVDEERLGEAKRVLDGVAAMLTVLVNRMGEGAG